jgi:integrase
MPSLRRVASIYARGKRLWGRVKDVDGTWKSVSTPYNLGDRELAERYIAAAQKVLDRKARPDPNGPPTVSRFAELWLEERKTRALASVQDDVGRINNHVLPRIGKLLMRDVRPRHIRDMIRDLRKKEEIADRTIRNTYGIAHAMFKDAKIDEVIDSNPCELKAGDLPGKTDADPEWREAATYTLQEVRMLIDDQRIPRERRTQYALKALAGLRHGEAAGLRVRHYDPTQEPLGRLLVATSYDRGRTKTDVTRRVPVHPALAAHLAEWLANGWPAVYGREPKPDDYLVPTRNHTPVDASDAGHAMHRDLGSLGLRQMAGKLRRRGGHDLRAWFITSCQEAGAHRDLLRIVTHGTRGDVMGGYTRATWAALCSEVAKLAA